jgi:hypothetical protein
MKWLILAIIIIFAQQLAKAPERKGTAEPKVTQSAEQPEKADHGSGQPQPPVYVTINNSLPSENRNSSKEQSDENVRVQRRLTFYTGLLVIAGFVTAALIWWQARETRRSVQAIRDALPHQQSAANAANLNAQALINAERPWVMIQIKQEDFPQGEEPSSGLFGKRGFQFQMFNYGKSPAHILDCRNLKFDVVPDPDSNLRIPPEYGPSEWNRTFLPPKDSLPVGALFHPSDQDFRIAIDRAQKGERTKGEDVVYGLIEYGDGISRERYRTAFCFRYERSHLEPIGRLIRCGPAVYNEYT